MSTESEQIFAIVIVTATPICLAGAFLLGMQSARIKDLENQNAIKDRIIKFYQQSIKN